MKLVVGCGYLGLRVARRWLAEGHTVAAVTRDPQRAKELRHEGLQAIVADVTRPETLVGRFRLPGGTLEAPSGRFRLPSGTSEVAAGGQNLQVPLGKRDLLPGGALEVPPGRRDLLTVLYAVGYDRRSGQSRWQVYVDGLKNVLDALETPPERFIFISSTGVYGEDAGGWVDEDSPCNPTRESGRALLAAEEVLQAHPIGRRAIILRLAGIYGPGRLRHAELRAEEMKAGSASPYINLIHADDAVSVVLAAEARAVAPRTYLVSDGHPVERSEFLACLARVSSERSSCCGSPSVAFRSAKVALDSRHFRGAKGDNAASLGKRVNSGRMMRELGIELRYPTYREGLAVKDEV
jgi:nucleoside-diphosphate-sugar epimerase